MKSAKSNEDLLNKLEKSVFDYDVTAAEHLAKQAVEEGIDLPAAIDCLTKAITVIGNRFGTGEVFLPELVGAGRVVDKAMALLEEDMQRKGQQEKNKGVVIIGTVLGDIHSIGKNMVSAFCRAAGFKVIDLGENVGANKFMEAVKRHQPNVLALSSLLTTTMAEQKKVIRNLSEKGLRKGLKIMVGGGPVTREYAKSIGADGYAPTAPAAAKLALTLTGGDERS
jgi:5-methyltetrahydrofolate--homocysteine methyltransferase